MSTGLTFGTITSLYGLHSGIIDRTQFSLLIAAVVLSAIVPTAAGILLDATVIRSLLVPALVSLMGRWNWWMPDALGRVLHVGNRSQSVLPNDRARGRRTRVAYQGWSSCRHSIR